MQIIANNETLYWSQPKQYIFHVAIEQSQEAIGEAEIVNPLTGTKAMRKLYSGPGSILYGGAAGGGKTEALVWEIYRWGTNDQYPGLKIGVFRKTFPEVEKYFISRCLDVFPIHSYTYQVTKHRMVFKETGTVVEFNSCEHEFDVLQYQGAQYDIIIIDELTHFSEFQFKYLRTRNRPSVGGMKCGFRPIFIAGTNPGGLGHVFVKRLFVMKDEYLQGEGGPNDYLFIPSKVWDNQSLVESDPEYVQKLEALPEMERRALLDGDWNIFAGQYFSEVRIDVHAFEPEDYSRNGEPMPTEWGRFIVIDYGYFPHPASVGWYAVDGQGTIYRYKELLIQRLTYSELAEKIVEMCTTFERDAIGKDFVIADPSIWAKKGAGEGKSGAEEMQDAFDNVGVKWLMAKADNDRINGWRMMHQYLKPMIVGKGDKQEITARLKVSTACNGWWKSVPELQHDPTRPDDVKKTGVREDTSIYSGDDAGDETRYAVMSRISTPKEAKSKEPETDRYGQHRKSEKTKDIYKGISPHSPGYEKPNYKGFTN